MKLVIQPDKKLLTGFVVGVVLCGIFALLPLKKLPLKIPQASLPSSKPITYQYDKPVELSGTLNQKLFYGPPGFGTSPDEDEKELHYLFVPQKPIKVAAGTSEFEKAYDSIEEMQIINEKNFPLKSYFGQGVKVSGSLMAAHTGHHHTDVLLDLDNISSTDQLITSRQKTPEKGQKEYTFNTYEGKKFSFSYSADLDLIAPTGYMVGQRPRLKPKGESIEDSYLITVDQPATSLGEGMYITWAGAPINFGNNWYKRGDARSESSPNKISLVIFQPQSPLPSELGSIYVAPWDQNRLDEALDQAAFILKTLKEVK